MGQTICEKILARYAGKSSVSPGEYVVVKDFVGPIGYSFTGSNFLNYFAKRILAEGLPLARPESIIVNGDHSVPAKCVADVEMVNSVREIAGELGVTKPFPEFVINIMKVGGQMNFVKERLKARNQK